MGHFNPCENNPVAVSCGYSTCFAVSACDGLRHLTKVMDRVETPFGFQPIVLTFVRHTVSRCLIFMLFNSYTSVSRPIYTEPSELLRLRLSEPIASESVEAQCVTTLLPLGDCHSLTSNFIIPATISWPDRRTVRQTEKHPLTEYI